jgi:single-strand DNA-binding protein
MAGSLNKVQLIGRLTRDPELRYTPSGSAVCGFSLAINRFGQDSNGERKEYVEFVDCVAWNTGTRKLAEHCGQYLAKGRLVYAEGRLQTRSWEDQQSGQTRYRTEVIAFDVQFLSPKDGDEADGEARPVATDDPDDIPF